MEDVGHSMVREHGSTGYDPAIHHRRSIRLRGHDYAAGGVYFVTLCVADRRHLFGTVVNERMALNDAGRAAAACWRAIPAHFPQAALDEWIVMPDHVHGIVVIRRDGQSVVVRANNHSPLPRPRGTSRTLGSIVRGFKIGVTKSLGGASPWQRNYYEIIVRDAPALAHIRRYIRDNPMHWDALRYGEPHFFAGNRSLLDLPLTAFLASRTGEKSFAPALAGEKSFAPTKWPERPAGVVSGFLSPMERVVFDACLADGTPMVWILARGLPDCFPPRIQRAIADGRLLAMTPFDTSVTGFSAARAAWCNHYALHLATNAVVGQLAPDGMLACLLSDLRLEIPVRHVEDQHAMEGSRA